MISTGDSVTLVSGFVTSDDGDVIEQGQGGLVIGWRGQTALVEFIGDFGPVIIEVDPARLRPIKTRRYGRE
jgi:hypothetical protein